MRHLASRFFSSMAQSPRQSEAGQPPASGLLDAADTELVALRVRHYLPPTPFAPGHRSADPRGPELGEPRDSFLRFCGQKVEIDRKSTRLNSSHLGISYAVFCLK